MDLTTWVLLILGALIVSALHVFVGFVFGTMAGRQTAVEQVLLDFRNTVGGPLGEDESITVHVGRYRVDDDEDEDGGDYNGKPVMPTEPELWRSN